MNTWLLQETNGKIEETKRWCNFAAMMIRWRQVAHGLLQYATSYTSVGISLSNRQKVHVLVNIIDPYISFSGCCVVPMSL